MNEAYAELATLRHVRVDGNAALEYFAEHVDTLVYELQLNKQRVEDLYASYTALNQVRLYFQNNYRQLELDRFRRSLNETVSQSKNSADAKTATKVRYLYDQAVKHCIQSGYLYCTTPVDGDRWLVVATRARRLAYKLNKQAKGRNDFEHMREVPKTENTKMP